MNLIIGVLTTISAIVVLGYIVFAADINSQDWKVNIPNYLLRLSLAIFIEFFSFFFLRLYRANLNEIKYYQNEITNIESKFVALEFSLLLRDKEAIRTTIQQLSRTERNFVLKKGESTVDLEKSRIDNHEFKELTDAITGAIASSKPISTND